MFASMAPRTTGKGSLYKELSFKGFTGLNTRDSNVELPDTDSPDLMNVEFDARGAVENRNGFTLALAAASQPINTIIPFYKNATSRTLLLTYGKSILQWDPNTSTEQTVTTALTGDSLRFMGTLDQVHQKMYLVNGVDYLRSWDGTTMNTYNSAPVCKFVLWYKNHMYMAGDPNNPARLYYSVQGDPTTWNAGDFIDELTDTEPITAIAQLGDNIVVFKENNIIMHKGQDPSDYAEVNTYAGKGTVSPYTVCSVPGGLMFLARDGVYLFDGRTVHLMSDKIVGSVRSWNPAQLQNAVAFVYKQRYWLSVPEGIGQQTNNRTYVYHYEQKWWTRHDIVMNAACVYTNTAVTPYFADLAGNIMQADTGTNDNGVAMKPYMWTKAFNFGTDAHLKTFKQVAAFALAQAGNYNLQITFSLDFGRSTKTIELPISYSNPTLWGFTWGQSQWGGLGQVAHITTNVPGMSRYLSFKIETTDIDAPFTFLGLVARYKVKDRVT